MKKIIARWDWSKVREFCIKYDYCTDMTNEEYNYMLSKVRATTYPTEADILNVIDKIADNSEETIEDEMFKYGANREEVYDNIVFKFMDECIWHTVNR